MEKSIEKKLNEFFATLKHTKMQWMLPGNMDFDVMTSPRGDLKIAKVYTVDLKGLPYVATLANAKLIVHAPEMLRSLCRTYLFLLVKNASLNIIRIDLDSTLASLVGQIADATGWTGEYVQTTFELYAQDIVMSQP